MRKIIPISIATLLVFSLSAAANSNELHKGAFGDGNNTIFQKLDGTFLIYCRDGAPDSTAWKCRRRKYEATDNGFFVQYNRSVSREDSIVLEINRTDDGYQLVYKRPRTKEKYWSFANVKPAKLKFKNEKYAGNFGPGKDSTIVYKHGRLSHCLKKKCYKHKVKSFGVTIRVKYGNGDRLYITPVSDTEAVGTYIQPDGQYTAHYKIAQ